MPVNLSAGQNDESLTTRHFGGSLSCDEAKALGFEFCFGPKEPAQRSLEHSEIVFIQHMLGLEQDGRIGPKTMAAVKRWNRENGIDHDYISEYLIDTASEMATAH